MRTPKAVITVWIERSDEVGGDASDLAENLVERWESKESDRTTVTSSWYAPATLMLNVVETPVAERTFEQRREVLSEFVVKVTDAGADFGCGQEGAPSSVMSTVRLLDPMFPGSSFASMVAPAIVSLTVT